MRVEVVVFFFAGVARGDRGGPLGHTDADPREWLSKNGLAADGLKLQATADRLAETQSTIIIIRSVGSLLLNPTLLNTLASPSGSSLSDKPSVTSLLPYPSFIYTYSVAVTPSPWKESRRYVSPSFPPALGGVARELYPYPAHAPPPLDFVLASLYLEIQT
jgi:hypothetical protein